MRGLIRPGPVICALVVLAVGCTGAATAAPIVYSAILNGPSESPPNASLGTGTALVTVDPIAHTMRVQATFSGLTGLTTVAHIHSATAVPFTGTVAPATTTPTFLGFPASVNAGTYDQTFDMTLASSYSPAFFTANGSNAAAAEAALFSGIANGRAYLNIHSNVFPGGEIRGFLVTVPEPISLMVFGGLVVGGGLVARKRLMAKRAVA